MSKTKPQTANQWDDIATQIQQLEQDLQEIKQRLELVRQSQIDRTVFEIQQDKLKADLGKTQNSQDQADLKAQIAQIQTQIEIAEVEIESRLVSWQSFREPFWQIVRFGGLGILLGVLIKSCAG